MYQHIIIIIQEIGCGGKGYYYGTWVVGLHNYDFIYKKMHKYTTRLLV